MNIKNKTLTHWQRGWLSGLFDSDGAICFNRQSAKTVTVRIQFDNRSRSLVYRVLKTIGSGFVTVSRSDRGSKGMKGKTFCRMFRYSGGSGVATWLLPQLRLIGKEEQRRIVIRALPLLKRNRWRTSAQTKKLEELRKRMTEVNAIGFDRSK